MKTIFEEMKAKREAMRQLPDRHRPRPPPRAARVHARLRADDRNDQRKEFAAARARDGFGQVWILEDTGKIRPIPVRTGITDNTYSGSAQPGT